VFLFSDTQIKDESFVEDLSNLLNTYEVPNLIGSGDLAGIFENIRPRAKQAGMDGSRDQLYNFFVQEVSYSTSCPPPMRVFCETRQLVCCENILAVCSVAAEINLVSSGVLNAGSL
jgi:hypothetical protein